MKSYEKLANLVVICRAKRYSVLFGQSPSSLMTTDGVPKMESESTGLARYFQQRITRMLKTENFGKSKLAFMNLAGLWC